MKEAEGETAATIMESGPLMGVVLEDFQDKMLQRLRKEFSDSILNLQDEIKVLHHELKPSCHELKPLTGSTFENKNNDETSFHEDPGDSEVKMLKAEIESLREEIYYLKKSTQLSCSQKSELCELENGEEENTESHSMFAIRQERASLNNPTEFVSETLPQDTFSFLMVTKYRTHSFFTALAVFLVQMSTFILLLVNTIDLNAYKNKLQIPVNVSAAVRVTQLFAIVITVLTQDDMRTGLSQINRGYIRETVESKFPHASSGKWFLSVFSRCLEGSLGIFVTFLFIVKAETVLDLLLNFTAMEFVSQLDEICFTLANEGFLGSANKNHATEIVENELKMPIRRGAKFPPIVLLVFTMVGMLVGWGFVASNQTSGALVCASLMVQFGDDVDSNLGAFSGLYDRMEGRTGFFENKKVVYKERRSERAMFGYCDDIKAWTFSYDINSLTDNLDPCHWQAKSSKTLSYDLEGTGNSDWFIKNENDALLILDPFYISCYDCNTENDRTQCGDRGRCDNAVCTCDNQTWFGSRCEFQRPCNDIEMDERFGGFLGTRAWSTKYEILKADNNETVVVYDRPVYVRETNATKFRHFDIILFTGRRWIATDSDSLEDFRPFNDNTTDSLGKYFQEDFHAFFSYYKQFFASQPMDKLTPKDSATPIGLAWYKTMPKTSVNPGLQAADTVAGVIPASLLCTICNDQTNPCQYEGKCGNDGKCQCKGPSGPLCQIVPIGNAVCDSLFNTPEYNYDGGDCCESTCLSNEKATCGKDATGYFHIGYPECKIEPNDWLEKGNIFKDTVFGEPPYTVALSYNGNTIAIGEPKNDRVRIFDKDGIEWVPRGPSIEGPSGTSFGSRVQLALFESDPKQVDNPLVKINLQLLVHTDNVFRSSDVDSRPQHVYLYECYSTGCKNKENFVNFHSFATISSYGSTVASTITDKENAYPPQGNLLSVQELDGQGNFWTSPRFHEIKYAMALSALGNVLAVSAAIETFGTYSIHETRTYRLKNWNGLFRNIQQVTNDYTWVQLGEYTVDGLNITESDIFLLRNKGKTLSLSEDGAVMAVGMPYRSDHPGVYLFQLESSGWIPKGNITGDDTLGFHVELNADGNVLMVGTGDDNGMVTTYWWNTSSWVAFEKTFEGDQLALSMDGSTMAISGERTPLVFHRLNSCPADHNIYTFSFVFQPWNGLLRYHPFGVFTSDKIGQARLEYAFNYFRSETSSSLQDTHCLPRNKCFLFDNKKSIKEKNVTLSVFSGVTEIFAGEPVDFVSFGACLKCFQNETMVRLVSEGLGPIDWYIRDSNGHVNLHGSITNNTKQGNPFPDFISDSDNIQKQEKRFMMWKDVCLPTDSDIEVGVRTSRPDDWRNLDPPALYVGDERKNFTYVHNASDYGAIFVYKPNASFVLGNNTSYFQNGFEFLRSSSNARENQTDDDSSTAAPSNEGTPLGQSKIISDPCNPENNHTIWVTKSADFCDKELEDGVNYILGNDITCTDGYGAILATGTCLNCQGFSLKSLNEKVRGEDWWEMPYIGIHMPLNSTGSTVYNCGIENFDIGIKLQGTNHNVIHSDILYSKIDGIQSHAGNNVVKCSKIAHSFSSGLDITNEDMAFQEPSSFNLSHSLVEGNSDGFVSWRGMANQNVHCSIIRNNFGYGIDTDFNLSMTDTILFHNVGLNIYSGGESISAQRVTSCGIYSDWAMYYNLTDMVGVARWADITCDGVKTNTPQLLDCTSSCTGSCEESATCEGDESILPAGCDEECTRPGRYSPPLYSCATDGDCYGNNICAYGHCFGKCMDGYSHDGISCVEINECVLDTNTCNSFEECMNVPGRFLCVNEIPVPIGWTNMTGIIEIMFDKWPEETSWSINDWTNRITGLYNGSGTMEDHKAYITIPIVLGVGVNYEIVVSDSAYDGLCSGGSFTFSLELEDNTYFELWKLEGDFGHSQMFAFRLEDSCESDSSAIGSHCSTDGDCCANKCVAGICICSFQEFSGDTAQQLQTISDNTDGPNLILSAETVGSDVPIDVDTWVPSDFDSQEPSP